jgi:hypothetical protein
MVYTLKLQTLAHLPIYPWSPGHRAMPSSGHGMGRLFAPAPATVDASATTRHKHARPSVDLVLLERLRHCSCLGLGFRLHRVTHSFEEFLLYRLSWSRKTGLAPIWVRTGVVWQCDRRMLDRFGSVFSRRWIGLALESADARFVWSSCGLFIVVDMRLSKR